MEKKFEAFMKALKKEGGDATTIIYFMRQMLDNITDEDIKELVEMYEEQLNYCHPLKNGTANYYHAMGAANKKIVDSIIQIKEGFKESEESQNIVRSI